MPDDSSEREADRFVRPLPPNPNLDKQRKLAKSLARDYWRGHPEAAARVRALHPKPPAPEDFALSDALLVIARGYGFAGWPQLKRKIDSYTKSPAELFKVAVEAGDVDQVGQLLRSHPDLVSAINEPMFGFNSPPCMSLGPISGCSISCSPMARISMPGAVGRRAASGCSSK
jgi:hypothetical protein